MAEFECIFSISGQATEKTLESLRNGIRDVDIVRERISQMNLSQIPYPVDATTLLHARQQIDVLSNRIRADIPSIQALQKAHTEANETKNTLDVQAKRIDDRMRIGGIQAPNRKTLPKYSTSGVKAYQYWALLNRQREAIGLPCIEFPGDLLTTVTDFHKIRESINRAEHAAKTLRELKAAMDEIENVDGITGVDRQFADILLATQDWTMVFESDARRVASSDSVNLVRQFESSILSSRNELYMEYERLAQRTLLPRETVRVIIRNNSATPDQLQQLKHAAIQQIKNGGSGATLSADTEQSSTFVLFTYDAMSDDVTITTLMQSPLVQVQPRRVWTCQYTEKIKLTYIETEHACTLASFRTHLGYKGVNLMSIYGCHDMVIGSANIRDHPAMHKLISDMGSINRKITFTCRDDLDMHEPPLALDTDTRVSVWNRQIKAIEIAERMMDVITSIEEIGDTSLIEHRRLLAAFDYLHHTLEQVRQLQNYALVHLRGTIQELSSYNLHIERTIAENRGLLEAHVRHSSGPK